MTPKTSPLESHQWASIPRGILCVMILISWFCSPPYNRCRRYVRNGIVYAVYYRMSDATYLDAYAVFTHQWSTYENRLGKDFAIFGSVEEM